MNIKTIIGKTSKRNILINKTTKTADPTYHNGLVQTHEHRPNVGNDENLEERL